MKFVIMMSIVRCEETLLEYNVESTNIEIINTDKDSENYSNQKLKSNDYYLSDTNVFEGSTLTNIGEISTCDFFEPSHENLKESQEHFIQSTDIYNIKDDKKPKQKTGGYWSDLILDNNGRAKNIFNKFVKTLKDTNDLKNICKKDVSSDENMFETIFRISYRPFRVLRVFKKKPIFFIELKRTLVELLFLIDDDPELIRDLENNQVKRNVLYIALERLYMILCEENNVHNYLNGYSCFSATDWKSYDTFVATELLNNLFFPCEIPDRNNKSVLKILKKMRNNTKRYNFIDTGFEMFDKIVVEVKGRKVKYPAKYYVLFSLLRNLF